MIFNDLKTHGEKCLNAKSCTNHKIIWKYIPYYINYTLSFIYYLKLYCEINTILKNVYLHINFRIPIFLKHTFNIFQSL